MKLSLLLASTLAVATSTSTATVLPRALAQHCTDFGVEDGTIPIKIDVSACDKPEDVKFGFYVPEVLEGCEDALSYQRTQDGAFVVEVPMVFNATIYVQREETKSRLVNILTEPTDGIFVTPRQGCSSCDLNLWSIGFNDEDETRFGGESHITETRCSSQGRVTDDLHNYSTDHALVITFCRDPTQRPYLDTNYCTNKCKILSDKEPIAGALDSLREEEKQCEMLLESKIRPV